MVQVTRIEAILSCLARLCVVIMEKVIQAGLTRGFAGVTRALRGLLQRKSVSLL